MKATEIIEKVKLIRKVEREPITINVLFEVCRLMSLNQKEIHECMKDHFNHKFNQPLHILEFEKITNPDKNEVLKLHISLDVRSNANKDFNIRLNITRIFGNKSYNYTVLFLNEISYKAIYDAGNNVFSDINFEDIKDLISLVMSNTIKCMKRWY